MSSSTTPIWPPQSRFADDPPAPVDQWKELAAAVAQQTEPPLPSAFTKPAPEPNTPPVPQNFAALGISESIVEQLILKFLYYRGEVVGRELANLLGLPFSLIDDLLENMKRHQRVGVKKSLGMGNSSGNFMLTDAGRAATREHLEYNQYVGPAPVPLEQYSDLVRRQRLKENWLNPDLLLKAFDHLVVEEDVLAQIGPAVNSNKSFLIYGQPGNGKTALAEALFRVDSELIYVPYAIESQGNIIQVYDPIYHRRVSEDQDPNSALRAEQLYDHRWFRTKRPFIVTGGELGLDMLDLTFNKVSKIYDAPFQVKANNGIYLIDDFGRQKCSPADILNRWIFPMERRIDYLSFESGGKMTVPFEAFLIFSTNLNPSSLGDEAFLRRIQYKMFLRSPRSPEFITIFNRYTESQGLACAPGLVQSFVAKHYVKGNKKFRRCHPRDVVNHVIDIINFESLPRKITEDLLDQAFASCFVEDIDVND